MKKTSTKHKTYRSVTAMKKDIAKKTGITEEQVDQTLQISWMKLIYTSLETLEKEIPKKVGITKEQYKEVILLAWYSCLGWLKKHAPTKGTDVWDSPV